VASSDPTYVGQVASVSGGVLRIRLRTDMPTTLVLVAGDSYRVGQIGGFFRVPVGYTQLYAVCSQVGADAAPPEISSFGSIIERDDAKDAGLAGFRWMTLVLFGESVSRQFERGVGQYPTIGDEVHFVTDSDLSVIYGSQYGDAGVVIGSIAAATGIPAALDLNKLVSRHCSIVGSTGSGKSNLVSVLLRSLTEKRFGSARVLVIDPHGEYSGVNPAESTTFRLSPEGGEMRLVVPYWALPFDELFAITFGSMSPANEAIVRDRVQELKKEASTRLPIPPPIASINADSPVPFSIKMLWFELDDFERQTFRNAPGGARTVTAITGAGNADQLVSNIYEPYQPGAKEPFKNPSPRGIGKQLELARSRLTDARYSFLFDPGEGLTPNLDGVIVSDLDTVVRSWVGSDKALTIFDVSELPSEVASTVVGLVIRVVYDTLFWAGASAIGGRAQPLMIVVDEAHRFIPDGVESSAHRVLGKIAKEGRKYGVGLTVITQRPSEIDSTVLSQCGTMIALRTTNPSDRGRVAAAFPDDLGGLVELLPSLRTGEAILVGEAMFVPSRVRIRLAGSALGGSDPVVAERWQQADRPAGVLYTQALQAWRSQKRG
jgi:hypothetical protein